MSDNPVTTRQRARERPTTVILVRHGETEANVLQVWHGALDAPLTVRGRVQVQAAAAGIAALSERFPVDAFYVSPLARTRSTAAAIAAAIRLTPQVEDGLREFDLGQWEGRTFQDLRENEQLWVRWERDPGFAPPDGESPRSFNQRAVATVQALAQRHPGQTVLIVTHGGVISHVLATLVGNGPQDWELWDPHNCAISILQNDGINKDGIEKDGIAKDGEHWRAVLINDISHLPPEAIVAPLADYAD